MTNVSISLINVRVLNVLMISGVALNLLAQEPDAGIALRARGRVTKFEVCGTNPDLLTARLSVSFVLTNTGLDKLILSRVWRISGVVVERTDVSDRMPLEHQFHLEPAIIDVERIAPNGSPQSPFDQILYPGDTYATYEDLVVVPVMQRFLESTSIGVDARFSLKITLEPWPDQETLERMGRTWTRHGSLWTKPVRSEPIELSFGMTKKTDTCGKGPAMVDAPPK